MRQLGFKSPSLDNIDSAPPLLKLMGEGDGVVHVLSLLYDESARLSWLVVRAEILLGFGRKKDHGVFRSGIEKFRCAASLTDEWDARHRHIRHSH